MIKTSQLLSHISRRLVSAKALKQDSETLIETVTSLHEELLEVKVIIADLFSIDLPHGSRPLPPGLSAHHALRLRCLYYEAVFRIHSTLVSHMAYPSLTTNNN